MRFSQARAPEIETVSRRNKQKIAFISQICAHYARGDNRLSFLKTHVFLDFLPVPSTFKSFILIGNQTATVLIPKCGHAVVHEPTPPHKSKAEPQVFLRSVITEILEEEEKCVCLNW